MSTTLLDNNWHEINNALREGKTYDEIGKDIFHGLSGPTVKTFYYKYAAEVILKGDNE